jgi:predicted regulator of Ras-like GTPase activity (Roadblock/LC7/MglB family)
MNPSPPLHSANPNSELWSENILSDLLALQYVRAVALTNGKGRALQLNHRRAAPATLAKMADLALAALTQAGSALNIGEVEVNACVYQDGVLLLAGGGPVRAAVLADAGANLGTLLNQVRRIFRKEEAP